MGTNRVTIENSPDFMDENWLSELIDRSLSSIRKDRCNGCGIPFIRIGRLVRYRKETVLRYLSEAEQTSTSHRPEKAARDDR